MTTDLPLTTERVRNLARLVDAASITTPTARVRWIDNPDDTDAPVRSGTLGRVLPAPGAAEGDDVRDMDAHITDAATGQQIVQPVRHVLYLMEQGAFNIITD